MSEVTIIGAGIGGLTAANYLQKKGLEVTLHEAHIYPGGCAGTFRHKNHYFDAGATLSGGFNDGEIMDRLHQDLKIKKWDIHLDDPAMTVRFENGAIINRYGDERRWNERIEHFGEVSSKFWEWQEKIADIMWDFAKLNPAWPPTDLVQFSDFFSKSIKWGSKNVIDILKTKLPLGIVQKITNYMPQELEASQKDIFSKFIDAQLLISSQATSEETNALHGASALDLPRRGVGHFEGGIGQIAHRLADHFQDLGGELIYRSKVKQIERMGNENPGLKITTNKAVFNSKQVIINLPPWNIKSLLSNELQPRKIKKLNSDYPKNGWGAFTIYLAVDKSFTNPYGSLHIQYVSNDQMTEGNTIFLSLSPSWDENRGENGNRVITVSTHTSLKYWNELYTSSYEKYKLARNKLSDKIFKNISKVFPEIKKHLRLQLVGTPITFEHFTSRKAGWVGGFPMTNLFQTWAPKLTKGKLPQIWMVGDSIFPGQSIPAVALGGQRVAKFISDQFR